MNTKRVLAIASTLFGAKVSQLSLADVAQLFVGVTEAEVADLKKVLAEEYGIYALSAVSFPVVEEVKILRPAKEKMFVPKSIGKVRNKALSKRRR